MATYWRHYILPRRTATKTLRRQPTPPDAAEMLRYLTALYRQVSLLPLPNNLGSHPQHVSR
jgi:hypothetical protein